jgi:hypothetical protein
LRKSPVRCVPYPRDRRAAEAFADSISIAVATSTAGILVSLN